MPISIVTDISAYKIVAISIFITAVLFGLLTLQDVEKVPDVLRF